MFVGVDPNDGLEDRRAHLIGKGDRADLHEAQRELTLENRVNGDDQRLNHVVEKMRKADRAENFEARRLRFGLVRG